MRSHLEKKNETRHSPTWAQLVDKVVLPTLTRIHSASPNLMTSWLDIHNQWSSLRAETRSILEIRPNCWNCLHTTQGNSSIGSMNPPQNFRKSKSQNHLEMRPQRMDLTLKSVQIVSNIRISQVIQIQFTKPDVLRDNFQCESHLNGDFTHSFHAQQKPQRFDHTDSLWSTSRRTQTRTRDTV